MNQTKKNAAGGKFFWAVEITDAPFFTILSASTDGDGTRGLSRRGGGQDININNITNNKSKTSKTTTTNLTFPAALFAQEKEAATRMLDDIPPSCAQQILDVAGAALTTGGIRKSFLALLGALIRAHQRGEFDPAPGLHLAAARQKRAGNQAALQFSDKIAKQTQPPQPAAPLNSNGSTGGAGAKFYGLNPGIRRKRQ